MKPLLEYAMLDGDYPCRRYHYGAIDFSDRDVKAGIGLCFDDEGRIVLTKHHKRGRELPGGKRESGEMVEQTLQREVREETGGIISDYRPVGVVHRDHHERDDFGILYVGKRQDQGSDLLDDAVAMGVFSLDNLPDLSSLYGDGVLKTLIDLFVSNTRKTTP